MPRVPYVKPALTHAAQLQQLKTRGLIIKNDQKALHLLQEISYYRLSGYWFPMLASPKANHVFKANSTFDNAFKLYCFDRELRKLVQGELEKIEVAIRAVMIYTLSHRHGSFWYTNPALFSNGTTFASTMGKISQEYGRTDEKFILDFKAKYSDLFPPSWMMLEITSFGSLSTMYKNLVNPHDKRDIAHGFGLDDSTFESWLHSIVYVRNVCAHHCRLWNRIMRITPQIPFTPTNPWITITTIPSRTPGAPAVNLNNRAYFFLALMTYLLDVVNPGNAFRSRFSKLLKKYPNVDVKAMGFPEQWKDEPFWGNKSWFATTSKKISTWLKSFNY